MRISATKIEDFRAFRDGVMNRDGEYRTTEEKLIQDVKTPFKATDLMNWGTAFHAVLEDREKYIRYIELEQEIVIEYHYKDKKFRDEDIKEAFEYTYPDFPYELKLVKPIEIEGEIINVVGKCDQWVGMKIIENKTRYSPFEMSNYYNSYQWRVYGLVFEVPQVVYQIFSMAIKDGYGICTKVTPLKFTEYQGMKSDVMELITDFVNWIHLRNLETYFKDK